MQEITITNLRNNMFAYLKMVKSGKELLLTSRGKAIARLMPFEDKRMRARKQLALLRGKCRIGDIVSPIW